MAIGTQYRGKSEDVEMTTKYTIREIHCKQGPWLSGPDEWKPSTLYVVDAPDRPAIDGPYTKRERAERAIARREANDRGA